MAGDVANVAAAFRGAARLPNRLESAETHGIKLAVDATFRPAVGVKQRRMPLINRPLVIPSIAPQRNRKSAQSEVKLSK